MTRFHRNYLHRLISPSLVLLATMAAPETGTADSRWYLAPSLSYIIADDDRNADNDFGLQLGIGAVMSERWNLEGNLEADNLDIKQNGGDFKQRGASLDGLYFFDRTPAFSPFARIGAGALHTKVPGETSTNPELNAGLGFLSTAFSERVGVRGEVRYRWDGDDNSVASEDSFGDWIVSLGLSIRLGAAAKPVAAPAMAVPAMTAPVMAAPVMAAPPVPAAPATPIDSDHDGVYDDADRCPSTPPGTRVDNHGCEMKEVIVLKGVNFATASARLLPESTAVLDDVASTLLKHPEIKAEVAGHTDNRGSRASNVTLSQRRAESVVNYLVSRGVPADHLVARGYGPDRPTADNTTEAGRATNRRVELRIID